MGQRGWWLGGAGLPPKAEVATSSPIGWTGPRGQLPGADGGCPSRRGLRPGGPPSGAPPCSARCPRGPFGSCRFPAAPPTEPRLLRTFGAWGVGHARSRHRHAELGVIGTRAVARAREYRPAGPGTASGSCAVLARPRSNRLDGRACAQQCGGDARRAGGTGRFVERRACCPVAIGRATLPRPCVRRSGPAHQCPDGAAASDHCATRDGSNPALCARTASAGRAAPTGV